MKKLILVIAALTVITVINAQSLEEIVKKYTIANKLDKVSSLKTIKITANMSMMGMEMPMVIWMKNPDKIKSVTSINGQEMIQAYDGVKGYMINPMTGSSAPVEMSQEQVKQTIRSNMFQNYMATYLKNGQLALAGTEDVKGKPAYKLKATLEGGTVLDLFIDKTSNLLVKVATTATDGGTTIQLDSFPTDYTETNGLLIPMKTTSTAQGMEFVISFTKVEVDLPMDDKIFTVN
jgi:hypothetical protein